MNERCQICQEGKATNLIEVRWQRTLGPFEPAEFITSRKVCQQCHDDTTRLRAFLLTYFEKPEHRRPDLVGHGFLVRWGRLA